MQESATTHVAAYLVTLDSRHHPTATAAYCREDKEDHPRPAKQGSLTLSAEQGVTEDHSLYWAY
jgi:hypothetical protein